MDYGDESYASGDEHSINDDMLAEINVEGAPIDEGALQQFLDRERTIGTRIHPYLGRGIAWIRPRKLPQKHDVGRSDFQQVESRLFQIPLEPVDQDRDDHASLTSNCADIFEELQESYNEDIDIDLSHLLNSTSNRYREQLSQALAKLSQTSLHAELSEADEEWQQSLFDSLTVWQCAEAIYLPRTEEALLCDDLMSWVNTMDPRPTQEDGEDIMTARKPYLHPQFWDYVSKGILRGLFEMVGTCLQNSGLGNIDASTSRAMNDLCLLLRTCPRVSAYNARVNDFRDRHRLWRAKVLKASKDVDLPDQEISAAFRQLYELLKGDRDAVFRQSDSWQECLAALALLFDPSGLRTSKDVRALFEMVTESDDFGFPVDRTLPSEEACAAFCAELIPKAITKAKAVDLSMAALLSDLLEKAEILEDIRSGDLNFTVRDVLVMSLGDVCICTAGSWRAAVTYWKFAGDAGLDSIQLVLPRIPVKSQVEVDEILTICNDLELYDEASEIETVWARRLESEGQYYEAVLAYDRANKPHQLDRLNWLLFEKSLMSGDSASDDSTLRDLLSSPQNTPTETVAVLMAPYATLVTMYDLKKRGDVKYSSVHLAALLRSADVPKRYMALLMAETLPIFNSEDTNSFSPRDIFDCLASIEEFYDSSHFQKAKDLLQDALDSTNRPSSSDGIPDWRHGLSSKLSAEDVLLLVREQFARYMGAMFINAKTSKQ